MLKRLILSILTLLALVGAQAQTQPERFFPYPQVPDNKSLLSERCNYLVYKFWEQCPIKQSFSSMAKLEQAFGDWVSFMPYATADTVNLAIDKYLSAVAKQAPDQLGAVGKMAEKYLYGDSAEYEGDDIYLRFANAMLEGKKVTKAEKARYAAQVKVIESSSPGHIVPELPIIAPDGSLAQIADSTAQAIILFFNDPDCIDCTLAKARLSADMYASKAVESGMARIVSIYPMDATDEWKEQASKYPEKWVVGSYGDADLNFDLGELPVFYVLDSDRRVVAKKVPLENILAALQVLISL